MYNMIPAFWTTVSNTQCALAQSVLGHGVRKPPVVSLLASTMLLACSSFANGTVFTPDDESFTSVGNTRLYAGVGLAFVATDNALNRATDPVDNNTFELRPSLIWRGGQRRTEFQLSYDGVLAESDLDQTSYSDHVLAATLDAEISRRSRFSASASFALEHEPLGTDFTRFSPEFLDQTESRRSSLSLRHSFGAQAARARIDSRLEIDKLDYLNNEALTSGSSFTAIEPSVALSLLVSSDTRAQIRVGTRSTDFEGDRERQEVFGLLGLDWQISGRTRGNVEAGISQYERSGVIDDEGESAVLKSEIFFYPSTFNRFSLLLARDLYNDQGIGEGSTAPLVTRIRAAWLYDWSSRVSHQLSLNWRNLERDCPAADESRVSVDAALRVRLNRHFALATGAGFVQRTGELCVDLPDTDGLDYDTARFFVRAKVNI